MSKMLSKMNLISVVQQLPKEDIETIQGYVEMIEEENQELELELSGYRQAILNNKEMLGLKEKNQELKKQNQVLKKQLENKYSKIGTLTNEVLYEENTKLINQQKEFIKYLKDEIYSIEPEGTSINYNCEYDSEEDYINAMKEQSRLNTLKEILQKYKEITQTKIDKSV